MRNFEISIDSETIWKIFFMLLFINVILLAADNAFATATPANANDVIGATLCRLVANLTGGIARGIATIAIFAVGVGLFLGKLNWGIAVATAAGVGIIFAAPKLVAFLSGNPNDVTCTAPPSA